MKHTHLTREKITGFAAIVAYALSGLALIIWPSIMTDLALYATAAIFLIYAAIKAWRYFKTPARETVKGFALATALMAALFAVIVLLDRTVFEALLPRVWGLLLLVAGFTKIQYSVDFYRLREQKWWWMLIAAAVSIVLGTLCTTSPDFIKGILSQFIGASLLLEGVIDTVALIFLRKTKAAAKKADAAHAQPAAPAPAAPQKDAE